MSGKNPSLSRIRDGRLLIVFNVWAQVVLALALLLLVNAIIAMTPQVRSWRIDCTGGGRHSVTSKTRRVLEKLEAPVMIDVVMGNAMVRFGPGKKQLAPVGDRVKDMVGLYEAVSPMVRARVVDFDREKALCLELKTRISEEVHPDTIIVRHGGRHETVPFRVMVKGPDEGERLGLGRNVAFTIEAKLTEAIIKVCETKRAQVFVLTGHGEIALRGAESAAMNEFVAGLRRENYAVRPLTLQRAGKVPAECDVLVIAGPQTALEDAELSALRDYLAGGGNAFVLLRPSFNGGDTRSLARLLTEYNVAILDGRLICEAYPTNVPGRTLVTHEIKTLNYGAHPITDDLKTLNFYTQVACPLTTLSALGAARPNVRVAKSMRRVRVTALVSSSRESWAETSLRPLVMRKDKRDTPGPCVIALAVEPAPERGGKGGQGARLVVVASYVAVTDLVMRKSLGNRVFAMNAAGWLARKEYKLGIPPQSSDLRRLRLTGARQRGVFIATVVVMPLAVLLCGGGVWWLRRRGV